MAHEQNAVGDEMTNQAGDYPLLRSRVEIDQDIATKNRVERSFDPIRLLVQIQPSELDHLLDFNFHLHLALPIRYPAQHERVQQVLWEAPSTS